MNAMQVFNYEGNRIRTVMKDGEPWFVGTDIATALRYSNTKDALATHVTNEDKQILQRSEVATFENHIPKSVLPMNFVSGDIPNRGLTIINESGLYSLIFSSKLEKARQFKRWVTHEVLPTIRKTGSYSMPGTAQPFTMEQMAQFAAAVAAQVVTQIVPIIVATVKEMYQEPTPMTTAPCEETISLHEVQPSRSHFRKKPGSIIDKLCPELRREVEDMLMDCRYTYTDIAAKLKQEGISISTSSICRYAKRTGCYAAYEQRVEI